MNNVIVDVFESAISNWRIIAGYKPDIAPLQFGCRSNNGQFIIFVGHVISGQLFSDETITNYTFANIREALVMYYSYIENGWTKIIY